MVFLQLEGIEPSGKILEEGFHRDVMIYLLSLEVADLPLGAQALF
jgi:hypothetical protein